MPTKPPADKRRTSAQRHARTRTGAELREQARTTLAKKRFLVEFRKRGIDLHACKAAKVGRRTLCEWKHSDPAFAAAYAEALEDAIDLVEAEALRRAVHGVRKPVYQQGVRVGYVQEYSDSLMQMVLKGRRGEIYNRERHEHSGPNGGPIPLGVIDQAKASLSKKLEQLEARVASTVAASGAAQ